MITIRIKVDINKLRRVPVIGRVISDDLARKAAYENLFFGTVEGREVLADMLKRHGALSPSFAGRAGFDPVVAAHNDGAKTAVLEILRTAGGNPAMLARAVAMDNIGEARDDNGTEQPE